MAETRAPPPQRMLPCWAAGGARPRPGWGSPSRPNPDDFVISGHTSSGKASGVSGRDCRAGGATRPERSSHSDPRVWCSPRLGCSPGAGFRLRAASGLPAPGTLAHDGPQGSEFCSHMDARTHTRTECIGAKGARSGKRKNKNPKYTRSNSVSPKRNNRHRSGGQRSGRDCARCPQRPLQLSEPPGRVSLEANFGSVSKRVYTVNTCRTLRCREGWGQGTAWGPRSTSRLCAGGRGAARTGQGASSPHPERSASPPGSCSPSSPLGLRMCPLGSWGSSGNQA